MDSKQNRDFKFLMDTKQHRDLKFWDLHYEALAEFANAANPKDRTFKIRDFCKKLSSSAPTKQELRSTRTFLNKMVERGNVIRRVHARKDTSYRALPITLTENDRLATLWSSFFKGVPIKILQIARQYNYFYRRVPDLKTLRYVLNELCLNGYGTFSTDDTITIHKPITTIDFYNIFKRDFPAMKVHYKKRKKSMLPPGKELSVPAEPAQKVTTGADMGKDPQVLHKDEETKIIVVNDTNILDGSEKVYTITEGDLKKVVKTSQDLVKAKKEIAELIDNLRILQVANKVKSLPRADMSFLQ